MKRRRSKEESQGNFAKSREIRGMKKLEDEASMAEV